MSKSHHKWIFWYNSDGPKSHNFVKEISCWSVGVIHLPDCCSGIGVSHGDLGWPRRFSPGFSQGIWLTSHEWVRKVPQSEETEYRSRVQAQDSPHPQSFLDGSTGPRQSKAWEGNFCQRRPSKTQATLRTLAFTPPLPSRKNTVLLLSLEAEKPHIQDFQIPKLEWLPRKWSCPHYDSTPVNKACSGT